MDYVKNCDSYKNIMRIDAQNVRQMSLKITKV
jgi:hypothetical protein